MNGMSWNLREIRIGHWVRQRGWRLGSSMGILWLTAVPVSAMALEIIGNYIQPGQYFPHSGELALNPPTTVVGTGNIQDVFAAAAAAWESRFTDPYTVTINYGWGHTPSSDGVTYASRLDSTTGRVAEAEIRFSNTLNRPGRVWFLDPTPRQGEEYGPIKSVAVDLGGGTLNTGRWAYAVSQPPGFPGTQQPGGGYSGSDTSLLDNAVHEIGHALNIYYGRLQSADIGKDGDVDILHGPFAGTQMPYSSAGGGHPVLPYPQGAMVMHGYQPSVGMHHGVLSDADVLLAAEVSGFKRVNLDSISYTSLPDFSDHSILTINGDAGVVGNVLQLTPDQPGKAGSAFLTVPYHITPKTSIETAFSFSTGGVNGNGTKGADGFAFVIQSDPRGQSALGNAGEGLGFGLTRTGTTLVPAISHSLAIEFDTHQNAFDGNGNHVAFVADGDVARHGNLASPSFSLNDDVVHYVWIDYDPVSRWWEVFLNDSSTKPSTPLIADSIDVLGLLGPDVYFGFTAGTGDGFNEHRILQWDLVLASVPEPSTPALFGLGSTLLAFRMRRRRLAEQGWVKGSGLRCGGRWTAWWVRCLRRK